MALLAEKIPEHDWKAIRLVLDPDLLGTLQKNLLAFARLSDAREVALDVGGEHRHAGIRKPFGHDLKGNSLAGAGRAGDQTVAVGTFQTQSFRLRALADQDGAVLKHNYSFVVVFPHRQSAVGTPERAGKA